MEFNLNLYSFCSMHTQGPAGPAGERGPPGLPGKDVSVNQENE